MKQRQNILQLSLSSFQFILSPLSIEFSFPKPGRYRIELEKGCQLVKEIELEIGLNNNKRYDFQMGQCILVKAYRQKNINFQWSVYQSFDGRMQFMDTFKVDLEYQYNEYIKELQSYQQYWNIHHVSEEVMARKWIQLKSRLKRYRFNENIKNSDGSISIQYLIQIRNELDYLVDAQLGSNQTQHQQQSEIIFIKTVNKNDLILQSKIQQTNDELSKNEKNILYLPIIQKRYGGGVLSDIIEASHEESQPNITDRSSRQSQSEFTKLKRANTLKIIHEEENQYKIYRRNNSLEVIQISEQGQINFTQNILQQSEQLMQENQEKLDLLTNQGTQIELPSFIRNSKSIQRPKIIGSRYFVGIIAIFFAYICLALLFTYAFGNTIMTNKSLFKNQRKFRNPKEKYRLK